MRQDESGKGRVTDDGKERDPGASDVATSRSTVVGPLAPGQRWTTTKKREVVLRIFRGESLAGMPPGDSPCAWIMGRSTCPTTS